MVSRVRALQENSPAIQPKISIDHPEIPKTKAAGCFVDIFRIRSLKTSLQAVETRIIQLP
jgi:hypothetical protein